MLCLPQVCGIIKWIGVCVCVFHYVIQVVDGDLTSLLCSSSASLCPLVWDGHSNGKGGWTLNTD